MVQNTEMATPLAMPPFFTGYPYQGNYCPHNLDISIPG